MESVKRIAGAGAVLTALFLAGGVQAQDMVIDCATEKGLQDALSLLDFTNNKDYQGLSDKLSLAFDKAEDQAKYCDGVQKLTDFQNKLSTLANATKPKVTSDPPELMACLFEGTQYYIVSWEGLNGSECGDKQTGPRGPKN